MTSTQAFTAEQARAIEVSATRCTHAALTALGFDPGPMVVADAGSALERIVTQGGSYTSEAIHTAEGLHYGWTMTLAQFMRAHRTGSFYLGTAGHALALVDGILVDTAEGGPRRRLTMAVRVSRASR